MAINETSKYDVDAHIAEAYDNDWATDTDDVEEIRRFIGGRGPWRILEPFCGTGRILLPLADDGHELVGMDYSQVLRGRLWEKLAERPPQVQGRVTVLNADVVASAWPTGFDLVIMGGQLPVRTGKFRRAGVLLRLRGRRPEAGRLSIPGQRSHGGGAG